MQTTTIMLIALLAFMAGIGVKTVLDARILPVTSSITPTPSVSLVATTPPEPLASPTTPPATESYVTIKVTNGGVNLSSRSVSPGSRVTITIDNQSDSDVAISLSNGINHTIKANATEKLTSFVINAPLTYRATGKGLNVSGTISLQ
jgi:hypothetical protein